ncbi:MAG: GDSL-type esterase/lipase family protein [Flavobacteriaceae bacterium]
MIKKEKNFKKALNEYLEKTINTGYNSTSDARIVAAKYLQKIFSLNKYDLLGTENLPLKSGVVFIYNHISNNDDYLLKNDFQITLDSHFISSMVSYKYYKSPGVRVIRHSLPYEMEHAQYYNKFGYIKVYSKNYLPENISKEKINDAKKEFYKKAKEALAQGENLIVNPEGISSSTETSPSTFKAGVFKMIMRSGLDPLIVPLVMTNFDKLNSETIYRCEIKKPFRLSSLIDDYDDRKKLDSFLINLNSDYQNWVNDLRKFSEGFDQEIKKLILKKEKLLLKKNLIVFYGSSSFRLWKNLDQDFKTYNVLNFGFGGAFIEDCIRYFDQLFSNINPTVFVLYVGGNDLSLEYSNRKINSLFKNLLTKIKSQFPNSKIICVSIKPSYHRINKFDKIKQLNTLMKEELMKSDKNSYVDIFKLFLNENEKIITSYFVKDNLHLSKKGYEVWKKEILKVL